jgi:hypothetical protein
MKTNIISVIFVRIQSVFIPTLHKYYIQHMGLIQGPYSGNLDVKPWKTSAAHVLVVFI